MMSDKLDLINIEIHNLRREQPWDNRLKAAKQIERQIGQLVSEAKKIIIQRAISKCRNFGFAFDEIANEDPYAECKFSDGFRLFIEPWFTHYRDSRGGWNLVSNIRYSTSLLSSNDKDFDKKIKQVIEKTHEQWKERKKIERINANNSRDFYLQVKNDVTYKSFNFDAEQNGAPWFGECVQMEHEGGDKWYENSRLQVKFRNKRFEISGQICATFDKIEDAEIFWDEFRKLVKNRVGFKKKER